MMASRLPVTATHTVITVTDVDRLHQVLERALAAFDAACVELGVEYFLLGGSFLGCIRHGGFIPWDDDVDVAMSQADFERFVAQGRDLLPQGVTLHTREDDPILGAPGKLFVDGTRAPSRFGEMHGMRRPAHPGVFVDILITYPIAESRFLASIERRVGWLVYVRPWARSLARSPRHDRVVDRLPWIVAAAIPRRIVSLLSLWLSRRARWRRSPLLGIGPGGANGVVYHRADVYPLQRRPFGNITALTPRDANAFLTAALGHDYMTLPPESEREIHSDNIELG